MHFGGRLPQLLICSCLIPKNVMQTKLGPISQYLSTTPTTFLNRRPDVWSCFASAFLLTIITTAEPCLFPVFCCSLRRFSFINQWGKAISCILVENSVSHLSNSIFHSPRYPSSNILYTLRRCQYSNISTPTITTSTVFATQIVTFDNWGLMIPHWPFQ